ncbi:glycerophosphodiester phosphodiesterase family protein [Lentzea sp. NEAU-D7]|uniref:glycerophosphodiester phosphodiesterase family protein n=1 Tax=Lentzea sp. NEAU-D7 TaxID=2994667 RepID=UPI00224A4984|nr:glycerophosphodiester phosphodiesterase family protein [Lentzea sp. NEAU-D7]MCX2948604.1 glycerophosphodiester phosphodiesterase family protein [Lentzea sp. NEAU-D7]MCX2949439.1 glycerophosphodiester phosphodiesterase family protein [Lentzea sp. NEAU-D7]
MQQPAIVAHRGASTDRPEHTIGAYELALEEGADGLECDIRLSKDGELVCVHDRTLARTSSGRGTVSALTLDELKKFDYGSWHRHGQPAGLLVLDELLELVKNTDVELFVETKHPVRYRNEVERKLAEALKRYGLDSQIVMMSFSPTAVKAFREHAPDIRTVLLLDRLGRYRGGALPSFADYTGPGVHVLRNDPGYVDRARRAGHETYVWTVDGAEDVALCRDLGVRYLATNAPANTRRLLTANLAT